MNEFFIPRLEKKWVFSLIFVRIPKNASTSVYNHLGQFNLINKYEASFRKNINSPLYRNWFDPTHAKPNEIAQHLPVNCSNYFSFAISRNPWDRFVSMHFFANKMQLWKMFNIKSEPDFFSFCKIVRERWESKDPHFFPTQDQVQWLEGSFRPNKIIRFENLQNDFASMLQELEIHHIPHNLPHLNSTQHKHYQNYYNAESKALVEEIFERDIETFKYTF
jgi:hypothetical protein